MKKILLLMVAALFLCGVTSAQNWGTPDPHAKSSNTPIVAKVTLGETVQEAGTLGAFVGNELRGLATIHTDGNFWIQAFYNEGETNPDEFTFKFYDGQQEYTNCTTTLTGQTTTLTGQEEGYGTPNSPVELVFANEQTMTQTTELDEWTWWSTPIEMSNVNGLQMLESGLGTNGVIIKGQNTNAVYLANVNRWVGNCPITNEASYSINVSNPCSIELTGVLADPEDHPITIINGWNWIGFPVNQTQTIASALGSDFQPAEGDVVKGQNSSAVYLNSVIGWRPSNFTFSPGCGYLYYSSADLDKTLAFRYTRESDANYFVDNNYWKANYKKTETNITLIGVVYVNGEEQRSENIELGAFINGECRGSSKLLYIEPLDAYYVIMTINGENGDIIDFELYNAEDGSVNTENETYLVYVNNEIVGEPNNPYRVLFNGNSDNMVLKVYPNPVLRNQPFSLNIPSDEIISQMIFTDVLGNVIAKESGAELLHQHEGFSVSGVYFAKILCKSGKVYYGRIVVE